MFRRTRPLVDPVTIFLDETPIPAERGEPLAAAIVGADQVSLARSPKLHRPRGPTCFRGGCDGCLARVDGVPNVMTCLHQARGGERIETQNVVGSRNADLLRVTDWFFPRGIDHHHLLAGVPGVSDVVQGIARKLAGLGRLPSTAQATLPARRLQTDVVIVGGGISGTAVARRLSAAGRSVCIVDDALPALGSSKRPFDLPGGTILARSTAAGMYLGELLVAGDDGASVVTSKAVVFATGGHDATISVPNNDLPGVMSARALAGLMAHGVAPTGPIALVEASSGDEWAARVERELPGATIVRVRPEELVAIRGSGRVRAIDVKDARGERTIKVVAVVIALPSAPSFELAAQAGAETRWIADRGYAIATDDRGRCSVPGLWAVGECRGSAFDPSGLAKEGDRVSANVLEALTT